MLHAFIATHRDFIIARTREKVARRDVPPPTQAELAHGVPLFLDQLSERLRSHDERDTIALEASGSLRGAELLALGLTIAQVVQDYGNICQAITEAAVELGARIEATDFRTLNECLDIAIAEAVSEYARRRERAIVDQGAERIGFLAHELRNLLNTATLAFDAVHSGSVGVGGSTGALVIKSLDLMNDLLTRELAELRLDHAVLRHDHIPLGGALEDIAIGATLHARSCQVRLAIHPVSADVVVEADGQILASVITNLVHNACKFTPAYGRVNVRTRTTAARVFIDVADECGGLPPGTLEELFLPYEQRGANRTGTGLGLAICMKGARAIGGDITVRDIPGTGCVFTLELRASQVR